MVLTKDTADFLKETQIEDYLQHHKEIEKYVVIDDLDLRKAFPEHCVVCPDVFTLDCYEKAVKILGKKIGSNVYFYSIMGSGDVENDT